VESFVSRYKDSAVEEMDNIRHLSNSANAHSHHLQVFAAVTVADKFADSFKRLASVALQFQPVVHLRWLP